MDRELATDSERFAATPLLAEAGGHAVGTLRVLMDVAEGRRLPVQLWYPAADGARGLAEAGRPILDFEPPGPDRDVLEEILRAAPATYEPRTMHAAEAPDVIADLASFPLVIISHCNECMRFGYFSIAERLASRGFVVAAPDHLGNTLYDSVNGTSVGLELDNFLERRRLDVTAVTDILLDPEAEVVPIGLRGKLDAQRIGMAGHSFGALTTSYASTTDARIRAVAFLAMLAADENNLPYMGEELAARVQRVPLSKPALFVLATEDLISILGLNQMIRDNFMGYPTEAYLATLKDTGHYSVFDLCGVSSVYANGCGEGLRATQFLQPFTYLDLDTALDLTAELVTTFFEQQLLGDGAGTLEDIANGASGVLTVEHRAPTP